MGRPPSAVCSTSAQHCSESAASALRGGFDFASCSLRSLHTFFRSSLDTMSDDFVRLVSQANPASRQQYQPANTGYPPSSSPPHALDPFFDDDDEYPDSAFGRSPAMQSKESGLPLARSAAPPAGLGNSQASLPSQIQPDQWSFDDDGPSSKPFSGSAAFPGPSNHERKPSKSKAAKKPFKWPWDRKERVLAGNRVVALNNSSANTEFCNNYVSTSKYNLATFVPKFLFGALSHLWPFTPRSQLNRSRQSNSQNTPMCSSSSPPLYSRYPTSPPPIPILPSFLYLLYY